MDISTKIIKKILNCPLLCGVDEKNLRAVLETDRCEIGVFEAKETVMSNRINAGRIGFLLSGKATVISPHPEKPTFLRRLNEGDAFGVSNVFSSSPFVSCIVAQSSCKALLVNEDALLDLFRSEPSFLGRYLAFLSDRIGYLNQKIGYLTAGSAERKLALYLLSSKSNEVTLDMSISTLSELLDVGRSSLYRAFDKLAEDGYIKKDGRQITVIRSEALLQAYQ